ncbi:MAG: hypothetical protein AAGI66_03210 [Cyanobacteria bacterium P01_H01_bin.74]
MSKLTTEDMYGFGFGLSLLLTGLIINLLPELKNSPIPQWIEIVCGTFSGVILGATYSKILSRKEKEQFFSLIERELDKLASEISSSSLIENFSGKWFCFYETTDELGHRVWKFNDSQHSFNPNKKKLDAYILAKEKKNEVVYHQQAFLNNDKLTVIGNAVEGETYVEVFPNIKAYNLKILTGYQFATGWDGTKRVSPVLYFREIPDFLMHECLKCGSNLSEENKKKLYEIWKLNTKGIAQFLS